jgi:hypothetical protein
VIRLAVLHSLLDSLRIEIVEQVETPQVDLQSEFGFGNLSGKLQILTELRRRLDEVAEEEDKA